MKRRDILKSGLLGLVASSLALSGCDKQDKKSSNNELKIIPKQTGTYEFSCPLPFNYKTIDEIAELNSTLKKSKVVSMYNNTPLPLGSKFNSWIQIVRGHNYDIKTYDDFGKYVKYAIKNGFKFSYLMNSPKGFSNEEYEKYIKNEFLYLLDYLIKIGCKDIKVSSPNVASLINEATNNYFNLSVSTAWELHNIPQYIHLFQNYPNFTLIDISKDENQNFLFLKNLKQLFPDKKIELMTTEPCMKGCPARVSHSCNQYTNKFKCIKIYREIGSVASKLIAGTIYPWDLEYYSAIGINNFKYVASNFDGNRANWKDITVLKFYLDIVENGIRDIRANDFFSIIYGDTFFDKPNIKMAEIMPYFPDIRHFVKHGHECSTKCSVECNYCYQCAKKLESKLLYS